MRIKFTRTLPAVQSLKSSLDRSADYTINGLTNLERLHTFEDWFDRRSPERSVDEIWDDFVISMDDEN